MLVPAGRHILFFFDLSFQKPPSETAPKDKGTLSHSLGRGPEVELDVETVKRLGPSDLAPDRSCLPHSYRFHRSGPLVMNYTIQYLLYFTRP